MQNAYTEYTINKAEGENIVKGEGMQIQNVRAERDQKHNKNSCSVLFTMTCSISLFKSLMQIQIP